MDYFERSDSEADLLPREGFPKYYQANIQKNYYVIVSLAVFTSLVYAVIIVGVHPPWLSFFAVTMWAPLCTVFSSISAVAAMNAGRKQYLLQFAIFTALGFLALVSGIIYQLKIFLDFNAHKKLFITWPILVYFTIEFGAFTGMIVYSIKLCFEMWTAIKDLYLFDDQAFSGDWPGIKISSTKFFVIFMYFVLVVYVTHTSYVDQASHSILRDWNLAHKTDNEILAHQ